MRSSGVARARVRGLRMQRGGPMDAGNRSEETDDPLPTFGKCLICGKVMTSPPEDSFFPLCLSCLGEQPDNQGEAVNRMAVMILRSQLRRVLERLDRLEHEMADLRGG